MDVKVAPPLEAIVDTSHDASPNSLPNSVRVVDNKAKSIRRLEPMSSSTSTVGTGSVAGSGIPLTAQNLLQRESISGLPDEVLNQHGGSTTPNKHDHHYTHNKPFLSKEGSAVFGKMSKQGSKISVYSSDNEGDNKGSKQGSKNERKLTNSSAGAKVAITDDKMDVKEDEKADSPPIKEDDKQEAKEEEEGSPYVMYAAYGISLAMGIAALVLYFMWKHTGGLTNGMSLLILILTIPSVCLVSADGYGMANDMVAEQYGNKRAIQVNVATGNGTELLSAITAFANGEVFLANNIIFSAMIINGLFVPSLSVLMTLYSRNKKFTEIVNENQPERHENFLNLQILQTLCVALMTFFLQPVMKATSYAVTTYLFYCWCLYYYLSKTYQNMMNDGEETEGGVTKTPWKIVSIYLVCTAWIVLFSLIATDLVPASALEIGIDPNFFSVIFALQGAIPELYKSIGDCRESGEFDSPKAVSIESNSQLCGFVLPVAAIIGSNFINQSNTANIVLDFTTCAFYALSTLICVMTAYMPVIEPDIAAFQLLIGVLYLISLV